MGLLSFSAAKLTIQRRKFIKPKIIVLVFYLVSLGAVFGQFFSTKLSQNGNWNGKVFLTDFHKCTCEPYNELDFRNKQSLIYFEVNLTLNYGIKKKKKHKIME
jgi:hypothetical protein